MKYSFIQLLSMSLFALAQQHIWAHDIAGVLDDIDFKVQAELIGSNSTGRADQGFSVTVSADGNTCAIGGPGDDNIGKTWVFIRSGNRWAEQAQLVADGYKGFPNQGFALSLSADGNTLAVGAPRDESICCTGSTWIFRRSGAAWVQEDKLIGTGYQGYSHQGWSVALSADGRILAVGAPADNDGIGATWIFSRSSSAWTQEARLIGTNYLGKSNQGFSVSLSSDGATLAVGSYYDNSGVGAAWIFTRTKNIWTQQAKLIGSGQIGLAQQGFSVTLSGDGSILAIGGPYDNQIIGATWIFKRSAQNQWVEQAKLVASQGTLQGYSVALTNNGTLLAAGCPQGNAGNGSIIIFTSSNDRWKQAAVVLGKGGTSGTALDLSSDGITLAVGGPNEAHGRGATWIFVDQNGEQ